MLFGVPLLWTLDSVGLDKNEEFGAWSLILDVLVVDLVSAILC